MAIGIGVATVATIGVTSTLMANAATVSGPYRMTVSAGQDYNAAANANCNARSEFLHTAFVETTGVGDGQVIIVFTCQAPESPPPSPSPEP